MKSLRSSLVLAALVTTVSAAAGHADAQAKRDGSACRLEQTSLSLIGCRLAEQLGAAAQGASVTVVELKSDRPLPKEQALRDGLTSAVLAALGNADARSKRRVELTAEKVGGVLRVSADVRRALGLWQRSRRAQPKSEAHAFAEVPLDAELRSLIPPPPLVVSEVLKLRAPERGIVAVACGPLGAEGAQELALVSRSFVRVGNVQKRAFVERAKVAWSSLSPVAATPLREPIGTAEITPSGALRVGLSDRRDGLLLDGDLRVSERYEGLLPVPGGDCAARRGVGLAAEAVGCAARAVDEQPNGTTLDALAGAGGFWLGRATPGGLLVSAARRPLPSLPAVGAQLALGDADTDGAYELLFSRDTLSPAEDRLAVVTLESDKARPRFELSVPGIAAVTMCQRREGPGMATLVVATSDELWLLR
jgi:hypothetical protein